MKARESREDQMVALTHKQVITIMVVIFAGMTLASSAVLAGENDQLIEVEVKGMFCPICAHKAEKKLKELEGVESVHVDLKAGKATVVTTQTHTHRITEEELKEAVKKAGFLPGNIKYIGGHGK